ncbi:uncharacterized protein FIBRA_00353 [Fibroporia radiculosa]|uniref:Uncharacterized protein n=1 Tax=Fibroporia radiculosa TaxID=599839 RepID=J7SCR7_9APHY|nr:uncharacterized protein FIBRA_00353 [Fibroporia radiculosa]CCL98358.1 predicted protein [Fibroporia radiculosa]
MDTSPPLPIPRLRLTRLSPQHRTDTLLTPTAGPSRYPSDNQSEDEEDAESTPRMPSAPMASEPAAESASARLRALLRTTTTTSPQRPPLRPATPSEADSDLDPPYSTLATPSFARESVKELFSHALRDSGGTPHKGRLRRNSVGTAEADESLRIERVVQERTKAKGKRRSMSDEEAEHLSNVSRRSEESLRSSQAAATYGALVKRLNQSRSMPPTPPPDRMVVDLSMPPADMTEDTATLFRDLNRSEATPPHATSTPMRSLVMSAQLQTQSNLLEGDSEMQRALRGMESDEGDSLLNGRPLSFPPSRPNGHPASPARPLSWTSHSKSHSTHNLPLVRRKSLDLDNSLIHAGSSQSGADTNAERGDGVQRERLHERERKWNRPQGKLSLNRANLEQHDRDSLSSGGRASPARSLSRRSSVTSLRTTEDGRSSRASSVVSLAEHSDWKKETERERQKEREREWNKPKSKLSRPSSSLSLRERTRTMSEPQRPESAQAFVSSAHRTLSRHSSMNSISGSSRAASPAGSVSSHDHNLDTKPEVAQERERNWNSPRPRWVQQPPHQGRPSSPMPSTLAPPPGQKAGTPPKSPRRESYVRPRANSSASFKLSSLQESATLSSGTIGQTLPRSKSPLLPSSASNSLAADKARSPSSASKVDISPGLKESTQASGFRSRFGWSFPQNRAPLPPLELDTHSPERPPQRPSSRLNGAANTSMIPVRSPNKISSFERSHSPMEESDRRRGHRRNLTEFSHTVGAIPPRIIDPEPVPELKPVPFEDSVFVSDEDSPPATSTPTAKPMVLPASTTPPLSPDYTQTIDGFSSVPSDTVAKPESPPLSPGPQRSMFSLQTPPRTKESSVSKLEFKTPSPPRNMPELPDPPSFTEEESEESEHTPVNTYAPGNLTNMKTPRPPGAWAQTPDHTAHDPFMRAQSTPPDGPEASTESILTTPLSTWPRASSVPLQTPAPPGAWMATPGTARRKSVLKVRFDVESETTVSDCGTDAPPAEALSLPAANGQSTDISTESNIETSDPRPSTKSEGPTKPRPVKKTSIRIVDAYGRETTTDPDAAATDLRSVEDKVGSRELQHAARPPTPRNRIVDAMGREIRDVSELQPVDSCLPLSHNEALARVRETIADMAEALNEAETSYRALVVDENNVDALEDASRAARNARHKISKSLQLVKNAESDIKNKYQPLKESMRRTKLLPAVISEQRFTWNAWLFWGFVFVQLIFLLLMFSNIRARRAFLTTYYDPFYADLYLYATKPDTSQCSIPFHSYWSISYVSDVLRRDGWVGVVSDVWNSVSCVVSSWQGQTVEAWSANYRDSTSAWPPT